MKIKVSIATGEALNRLVAQCQGECLVDGCLFTKDPEDEQVLYDPTTDWAQGGPIIEQEKITIEYTGDPDTWCSGIMADQEFYGSTPLIAAMRCLVASKLGDEVELT